MQDSTQLLQQYGDGDESAADDDGGDDDDPDEVQLDGGEGKRKWHKEKLGKHGKLQYRPNV